MQGLQIRGSDLGYRTSQPTRLQHLWSVLHVSAASGRVRALWSNMPTINRS